MPLSEVDLEQLRAEHNADQSRFSEWDPNDQFRHEYAHMHPERYPDIYPPDPNVELERVPTAKDEEGPVVQTSHSNSTGSAPVEYAGIRARPRLDRNNTSALAIHKSETHRVNGELERNPTALDRISTHRTQHSITVGGTKTKKEEPLPEFGAGKPYPPALPDKEEYVVEFDGPDDPMHAQNWPFKKKLLISCIVMYGSLSATFGSSLFSPAAVGFEKHFHVGSEVGTLGTSLFVLGYAFGPIIWAPMSELLGRRLPIVIATFGFGVFALAVAVGKDVQTVMISRFFNGLFGSAPLAVTAAIFADIYDNETRGLAVACFAASVFMGPLLAPFVGGFITTSRLGWRWTMYISSIMGFSSFVLSFFFLPETYAPVILVGKASELRRRTQNWGIHAKQEEIEVDVRELITKNVARPMKILFTEPIVLLITIYISFIYGLLYLLLTAEALVFQGIYHFTPGVGGLPYFGLMFGELIAFVCVVVMNPGYVAKLKANHNVPVPEWRLPLVMVGGVVFAIGLFWFGWTSKKEIHWIVPTLAGIFIGFGIFSVFLQLLNYIIDAYLMFAASAVAANTFLRSIFGAVFPLFARYMFDGIGIDWGSTLIGCVAVLLVPLPFFFFYFGRRIRAKSTFAPAPDIELDRKRDEEKRLAEGGEA